MTGIVFDIQRFSIHDGPGIRTTIFLKGCPLHCFWCHNPEGIRSKPEIQFFSSRCINCGACIKACQHGARIERDGGMAYLREKCITCGACVETCYAGATVLVGRQMTVEQVMDGVLADRAFYETSGGGVTLSGGEPAIQRDFSKAILERCKAEGLHTAIETAGHCRWSDLAVLLPVTDLVMMDIKHLDPDKHRSATGVSSERILENARRLALTDKPIIFRVPVVPTVNDTTEEIGAIAEFVCSLAEMRVENNHQASMCADSLSLELLPFHRLAGDKYRSMGLDYRAGQLQPPTQERMAELTEMVRGWGITIRSR